MPRRDNITLITDPMCGPTAHCTQFDAVTHPTCAAYLGSPVVCGGDSEVSGFAISDGCDQHARLFFHSIVDFREWILHVTDVDFRDDSNARFIVSLFSYTPPSNVMTGRCFGTVISDRHVLAPASCARVPAPLRIAVRHASGATATFVSTEHVFIHPRYVEGVVGINNVAVIRIVGTFDTELIPPRILGGLSTNSTCTLRGWGGPDVIFPLVAPIGVFAPEFCYGSMPQAFCSTFDTAHQFPCSSRLGAPIICGPEGRLDGFVITENQYCNNFWGRNMLHYHSVEEFRDWIEEVSGVEMTSKVSVVLILSVLTIRFSIFM